MMNTQDLVWNYLQKRRELADACGQPVWKSCRAGHVQRVSLDLSKIEELLEAADIDIDAPTFSSMILGRADADADARQSAFRRLGSAPDPTQDLS